MRIMKARWSVPLLALALLVAGCGGGDDKDGQDGSDAGAASGPSSSAPATGSPATTDPSTPTASVPGKVRVVEGLPAGFPTDEVPLLDGKIVSGARGEPGSQIAWSVVLQPEGDIEDIVAAASAKLSDAGFALAGQTDLENLQVRQYQNAGYQVGLTVAATQEGNTVTYVVAEK